MPLTYEVTGYDRRTDRLRQSHGVPDRRIASVKKIAGVPATDDGLGSYPLTSEQVGEIARVLETAIDQGDCVFFLELHEESKSAAVG